MSGAFGVGSDERWVEWSRQQFHLLAVGGVWGVPRSGLVFTRTGEDTLALTEVMPYDPAMPVTARRLFDQQAGDFLAIQGYMKRAGITTHDLTGMFEED
jgi:hypothetical protein